MLMTIFEQYIQVLWNCFQYDIGVFSNIWMYIPLMIPVVAYGTFFILKWFILTFPIWFPFMAILSVLKRDIRTIIKQSKKES